jgi:hypothetical protein
VKRYKEGNRLGIGLSGFQISDFIIQIFFDVSLFFLIFQISDFMIQIFFDVSLFFLIFQISDFMIQIFFCAFAHFARN